MNNTANIVLVTIGCGAGNLLHSLRSLRKLPAPQPPDANTFTLGIIKLIKQLLWDMELERNIL